MPKSRSRGRADRRRYQLKPDRKKPRRKPSPRWYPPLVLGIMAVGVLVIVLNYMGIMPFSGGQTKPAFLMGGLALIAIGFLGTTGIR
jgi:cell division protein CrgA